MQAASSPSKCTVGFNTVVLMPRFLPKTVKTDSIHNLVNCEFVKNVNFDKKKTKIQKGIVIPWSK